MKSKESAQRKPSYLNFDRESYPWKADIDYSAEPEKYRVGKGEQGVLICQPYKAMIVSMWKFRTPELAEESSRKIFKLFNQFLKANNFVGADMARKFLQMGFTRARRYANYKGGLKYDKSDNYRQLQRGTGDDTKAESAQIFYDVWQEAEANKKYAKMKKEWLENYG